MSSANVMGCGAGVRVVAGRGPSESPASHAGQSLRAEDSSMQLPRCATHGQQEDCLSTPVSVATSPPQEWLEQYAAAGFRVWQIMFLCFAGVLALVIFLCCCIRFRIPRTKQEIEADYMRKKITRKFQKQLRIIQNAEMDDMDLKRALDRVRAEFKSDTESLAQSEALSGATLSSGCNCPSPPGARDCSQDPLVAESFRKPSDGHIGISLEDIQAQHGIGAKFSSLVGSTLTKLRPKKQ